MIVVYPNEEDRREDYIFYETIEKQWNRTQDRPTRKKILLTLLQDHLRWQSRANANLWTIVEMLLLELVRTKRQFIGHNQQLADIQQDSPLTLERIRGMCHSEDTLSKLSDEDLRGFCDWLDLLFDEIYLMKCIAMKEIDTRLEQTQ